MAFLESHPSVYPYTQPLSSPADTENICLALEKASCPCPNHESVATKRKEGNTSPTEFDERQRRDKLHWMARLLPRSPRSINEKRATLLTGSPRSSLDDVESQISSTDASTLYDEAAAEQDGTTSHPAKAKIDPRLISDAIIGLSDGLTVPFALTAGLSALGNTNVVIYAGLAELTAGAISMGLGGYLGAKSEEASGTATRAATTAALASAPSATLSASTATVFAPYDLPSPLLADLTAHLAKLPPPKQASFLMAFEHQLPADAASSRALVCALTIAGGYFLGGFVPLLPYFFVGADEVLCALWWSLGVMAASLFAFGYGKTCFVGGWSGARNVWAGCCGGVQMVVVGGVAAGCAMGLVRLFHGFAV